MVGPGGCVVRDREVGVWEEAIVLETPEDDPWAVNGGVDVLTELDCVVDADTDGGVA